jgi:hypothetical protein
MSPKIYNPPPNWPQPPAGWTPPPDWKPDPSWPEPPEGWQVWIDKPDDRPKQRRRAWILPVAVGVIAFLIGIVLGGLGGAGDSATNKASDATAMQKRAEEAETALSEMTMDRDQMANQVRTLEGQVAELQNKAGKATATAAPKAPAATIAGDGTFLVGTDVKPGQYRGNTSGGDCYWARLSSTSGGDNIIDNGLSSGPQVVTIKRTDKAFESQGCGEWTKI